MRQCLDRVGKNEISQNSDITPKTNKQLFPQLKTITGHMIKALRKLRKLKKFQNRPEMPGKQDRTVEIQKSI